MRLCRDRCGLLTEEEEEFDGAEVFLGVDADGVDPGGLDVDGDAVFEEAELFQAFGAFQFAWEQTGEALQGGGAVGVEADVFPVEGGAPSRLEPSRPLPSLSKGMVAREK